MSSQLVLEEPRGWSQRNSQLFTEGPQRTHLSTAKSASPAPDQQWTPNRAVFQRVTRSPSLYRWFLTSRCGVTLGSAHRISSVYACETLAIKTECKLWAREKKALILYNTTAVVKLCMCQNTCPHLHTFNKRSRHHGQFILVKAVFQFLFYVQQQRWSEVTAESCKNHSTPGSSEPCRGFTTPKGMALHSCYVTRHSERWLTRTPQDLSPLRTCTPLLCTRNLSSRLDLPNS